ncbi:unnamed protein product [Clonostachys rhizophaga]|uniref:C2H2-type domain-containing protein n=1 Tax=Clonostachys rhizophaga TaxID=160324 RepID=A0A9N9YDG5_9HYPO|nr:unnamed protein product [Clonostachys rhizophaga]
MADTRSVQVGVQAGARRRQIQERKCPQCGQVFSKTEHLARHIRSHTKERPFECECCGKAYSRHDSLLRHARTHVGHDGDITSNGAVVSPPPSHSGTSLSLSQSQLLEDISTLSPSAHQVETLGAAGAPEGPAGPDFSIFPTNILNPPGDIENAAVSFNIQEPAWLLGEEFDINALNSSISTVLSEWAHYPATIDSTDQRPLEPGTNSFGRLNPFLSSQDAAVTTAATAVQQKWHTRLSRDPSPQPSSEHFLDQDCVDDMYREGLSHRLQPRMSNPNLPSADFLNLCVKLYFSRFNPVMPLIHAPSFRPSSENALVLLSICSIGALFIGTASAAVKGRRIFQILNKAVLASWENYIRRGSVEALSLIQAATIGQTFGMLSGQSQDLCLTESFHGTIVAWARQAGLFNMRDSLGTIDGDGGSSPEYAWKRWAQAEASIRLVLALHVHDTELATTFHHEPLLRHTVARLPQCCSDELFSAASAMEWQGLVRTAKSTELSGSPNAYPRGPLRGSQLSHRRSMMFWYASLAGILASIQEIRGSLLCDADVRRFQELLLQWHHDHDHALQDPRHHPIGLVIMWHLTHIALYADLDLLERAIGRDRHIITEKVTYKARIWSASPEGRRSVLHAWMLLKRAESLSISVEPAMHVPRALFIAAIVIHCYTKFGPTENLQMPVQNRATMPEFMVSWTALSSQMAQGIKGLPVSLPVDPSMFCNAIDLLRRIGHWEISHRYASILECLWDELTKG